MAYSFQDYLERSIGLVKDDGPRLDPVKDPPVALGRAARWISNYAARLAIVDLTSDGSGDFPIAGDSGLADWSVGFSEIDGVEYPIAAAGTRRAFLSEEAFEIVDLPGGAVIRVYAYIPAGDKLRITHTALHLLTAAQVTVPDSCFEATCEYAAAGFFDILAAKATPTTERAPQIGDLGGFRDLSDKFATRAKQHRDEAERLLTGFVFV